MANGHADLAPSGAKKWMTCAGAPAMEAGEPNATSKYSAEGTVAHFIAALCLTDRVSASKYAGVEVGVWDAGAGFTGPANLIPPLFTFTVDDDMVGFVQEYVDKVMEYVGIEGIAFFEQRMPISDITGEANAFGTGDAIILRPGELQAHDLKYGMGIRVSPVENEQEMIYALAALPLYEKYRKTCSLGELKTIRLVIHQPRLNSFPEWSCTLAELLAFGEKVKDAAKVSLELLEVGANVLGGEEVVYQHLVPGNHCGDCFCKAQATCPALAKKVQDEVGADFEALAATKVTPEEALSIQTEGQCSQAGNKTLGTKMDAIPMIESWCKAVRAKVESELFLGRPVQGYKLVKGRKGRRSWNDATLVDEMLKKMRLKEAERYKQTLKSPTQIEELLKTGTVGGIQWKKIQAHVTQAEGSPSVAEASDPREAIVIPSPDADFGAVTTDDDFADMVG